MKKILRVVSLLLVAAACDPKPGTRKDVKGHIEDVTRPVEHRPVAGDATHFYWTADTGAVMARPRRGGKGEARPVFTNVPKPGDEVVAVARDGAAIWTERGVEIAVVSSSGGVRRVRFDRVPLGAVGPLAALDGGDTVVWDEVTADRSSAVLFAANLTAGANAVREAGRVPLGSSIARTIEPASRGDGFAVTMRSEDAQRVLLFDDTTGTSPPREIWRGARSDDDEPPVVKLGTHHVFIVEPTKSPLDATPMPLLAIARKSGRRQVVDPSACRSLAVIDDDPLYVSSTKRRCPGELPEAQRIDVRRGHGAEAKSEIVYAVHTGALWLTRIHGSTLLVDERIPTPHPEGSAPTYDHRSTLLTLR